MSAHTDRRSRILLSAMLSTRLAVLVTEACGRKPDAHYKCIATSTAATTICKTHSAAGRQTMSLPTPEQRQDEETPMGLGGLDNPCDEVGCPRSFPTARGLAVHAAKCHAMSARHFGQVVVLPPKKAPEAEQPRGNASTRTHTIRPATRAPTPRTWM